MQAVAVPKRTKDDRCDRCGAEAFVITSKGMYTLLFCGHHGKKFQGNLELMGWEVLDFTDEIG